MKIACYIWVSLLISFSAQCQQYYLRGEVKDESGNPLQNVTILHVRSGFVYKSGFIGSFGITIGQQVDTFNFSLDGYRPEKVVANSDQYLTVQLKLAPDNRTTTRFNKLQSFTRGIGREEQKKREQTQNACQRKAGSLKATKLKNKKVKTLFIGMFMGVQ